MMLHQGSFNHLFTYDRFVGCLSGGLSRKTFFLWITSQLCSGVTLVPSSSTFTWLNR